MVWSDAVSLHHLLGGTLIGCSWETMGMTKRGEGRGVQAYDNVYCGRTDSVCMVGLDCYIQSV